MRADVNHHVKSCHECQIRSLKRLEIPLTVSVSTRLFAKVYIDVMHMPVANGFHYIVAAKDDLSETSEAIPLRHATAKALAKFLWEYTVSKKTVQMFVNIQRLLNKSRTIRVTDLKFSG